MINADFVRLMKLPTFFFDAVLFAFLTSRIADVIATYWPDVSDATLLGIPTHLLAGFGGALIFFSLLVLAWYCQIERSEGLADSESGSLEALRIFALIGAVTVFAVEGGITLALFNAEYSNPFRTVSVPTSEKLFHAGISLAFAVGHLVFSYFTACLLVLHLREKARAHDEAILKEAQLDGDDINDFELHAAE